MDLKFDLHVHTENSLDSNMSLLSAVASAKKAGISGIAITDHNCFSTVPEEIDEVLIISGCEYSTNIGHLLVYFLSEDISKGLSTDSKGRFLWQSIVARAHAQDALVFLAHPFAPFYQRPEELYQRIDGIEIYNARIEHSRIAHANEMARDSLNDCVLAFSAGSDAHFSAEIGAAYWVCTVHDEILTGGASSVLKAVKHELSLGNGSVYGGRASPIFRPASQCICVKKLRAYLKYISILPRFLRAVLRSLKQKTTDPVFFYKGKLTDEPISHR